LKERGEPVKRYILHAAYQKKGKSSEKKGNMRINGEGGTQ